VTLELQLKSLRALYRADPIVSWRLSVLERAGYDEDAATILAASKEVDLHAAVGLLEHGCPVDTALRIFL
jgi:hypothetical protein